MADEQIPQWTLSDRMRKALYQSRLDSQEMAEYLGVSRTSVSNWITGRNRPSKPVLRLWALRCGVPFEWLIRGHDTEVVNFRLVLDALTDAELDEQGIRKVSSGYLVRKSARPAMGVRSVTIGPARSALRSAA